MKNEGKVFEKSIQDSIPDGIYYLRIKDSANSYAESSITKFTPSNPYDQFIFYKGTLFPIELKSTKNTSLSIQRIKGQKSAMIKLNQIEGLTHAGKHKGISAGFLIDFRTSNNTYWLNIDHFNDFVKSTDKKSINEKDIIEHNGILVSKKLKKIHYRYDIQNMLEDILRGSKYG